MKVILPLAKVNSNKISESFHNTEYTIIYDCLADTSEQVSTKSISNDVGNLSFALKRNGIKNVISKSMSPMALRLFNDLGFSVFKAKSDSIKENISLFKKNKLELFGSLSFAASSDCTSGCSSCKSSCN